MIEDCIRSSDGMMRVWRRSGRVLLVVLGALFVPYEASYSASAPLTGRALTASTACSGTPVPAAGHKGVGVPFVPRLLAANRTGSRIFVAGDDRCTNASWMAVVDAGTARLQATVPLPNSANQLLIDNAAGRVIVSVGSPYPTDIIGIDLKSVRLVWRNHLRGRIVAMAVDEHQAQVIVALDPAPGSMGNSSPGQPLVYLVGTRSGRTRRAIHPHVGALLGTTEVAKMVGFAPDGPGSVIVDHDHGRVYIAGQKGVAVLAEKTGQVLGRLGGAPCTGELGIDTGRELLYAAKTGMLNDRYNATDPTVNPPGHFCIIDLRRGATVQKRNMGIATSVILLAVDPAQEVVLLGTQGSGGSGDGPTRVVNGRDGRAIRTVSNLDYPPWPALNIRGGIVFATRLRYEAKEGGITDSLRLLSDHGSRISVLSANLSNPAALLVTAGGRLVVATSQPNAVLVLPKVACSRGTCSGVKTDVN